MIKTRKAPEDELNIVGTGEFIMALNTDQLELLGALLGMVKLGQSQYQNAAFEMIDLMEELTGDDEYSSFALGQVMPIVEIHDGESYDVIATYDDDHIIEFIV